MRILLVNEYVESRGAEQIVKEQLNVLTKNGHKAHCLCFSFSPFVKKKTNLEAYTIISIPKIGKFLFLPQVYFRLRSFLRDFSPEVIILHNIYSSPLTVFRSLAGYKVFQVVHDYKIVCPTAFSILLKEHNIVCVGYKHNCCLKKCSSKSPTEKVKLLIRLYLVRVNEKLRKRFVGKVLAPSNRMCEVLYNYGYKSFLLNNPIQVEQPLRIKKSIGKVKRLLYVGGLNFEKGILPLLKQMLNKTQCSLDIYGGIVNGSYTDKILDAIDRHSDRIKYCGSINHDELMRKMIDYDYVVVPSIWVDNYPTIILEGMAHSVGIIASDRGGAVDLLSDGRGLLFSWDDKTSLSQCLVKLNSMTIEEYNAMVSKAYSYVCENNSSQAYYLKLIKYLK